MRGKRSEGGSLEE